MKIKMQVDINPKELRKLLGLPDVAGMQEEAIRAVVKKMKSGAEGFEPVTLLKQWVPGNLLKNADLQGLYKRFMQDYNEDEVDEDE
jgi:hypothetical protein